MNEISKKKQQLFENGIDIGNAISNEKSLAPNGRIQVFERGTIIYHPSFGACYLSERVARKWQAVANQLKLGFPISDTRKTGQNDELCLFENGLIVCRPNGGDFAVAENVYRAYISSMGTDMANFPGWVGYPISDTRIVAISGWAGAFEHADIYQRELGPGRIVHGAIRARYNQLGAENALLGLPISDEYDLKKNDQTIGRASNFEQGTIYWSTQGGAHALQGDFLNKYQMQLSGPAGPLGMPLSEEMRSPGGRRYANFQFGIIVQQEPGVFLKIDHLEITLTKLQTDEDDDDLFVKAEVLVNQGGDVKKFDKQYGEYSDQGTKDDFLPEEAFLGKFFINDGGAILTVNMQAWEIDSGLNDDDDFIASFSKSFGIDTLWDPKEPDQSGNDLDKWYETKEGKFRASFRVDIESFKIDPFDAARFNQDLWWNVDNYGVTSLSKEMYAATFADVDENDSNFWHQLLGGFYKDRYKNIGNGGVCFGICLEAIYALKGRSTFRQPISQHTDKDPVNPNLPGVARNREFQHRHGYQLSCERSDFLSDIGDNIWNPLFAYDQSQKMFIAGNFPIFSISDGLGKGHALVPFQWIDNGSTLTIKAVNPNKDSNPTQITINRAANTFTCQVGKFPNGAANIWMGGAGKGNGGRLVAIPFSIYANVPHTDTAAIGFDLTVIDAADGQPRRPVFAHLGIVARGNKALFQVGGQAKVRQVTDGAEGGYFKNQNMFRRFRPMQGFMGLYPDDGLGVPFHPNTFVLTTSAERPLFHPADLPDDSPASDKWHVSHLAALLQSRIVMPNLLLDEIKPLYLAETISQVQTEAEFVRQRSRHESLHFYLENTQNDQLYHWYMAARHAIVRLETNAVESAHDMVIAEQVGEAGQLVTFVAGGIALQDNNSLQVNELGDKKLKASLLNAAQNRMWVLQEMKTTVQEPLSFQLNNGGNQVWVYNANNNTDVDIQFWENEQNLPDAYLPATPLAANSITGFESVAPNSIKKEVYLLPGGDPISSVNYSNFHLDCQGLLHEWLVLSQAVTGLSQISTNMLSDRPDTGGWFFCHKRVVDFCVEDGDYFIVVQSGALSLVNFTVRAGVVTYPAELEGVVSGQGTNTLVLHGMPLTIDAQAVQDKLIILPGVYGLSPDPVEHMSRPLVSGNFLPTSHDGTDGWFYNFIINAGESSTFMFQFCLDGVVRYDPVFEGMVTGHGTNVLTITELIAR
jgi:hypothetical protein